MKRIVTLLLLGLSIAPITQGQFSNCGPAPTPVVVYQPDGSPVTLYGKGSNLAPLAETQEGYTVIKNTDGFYYFATQDATGRLVPGTTQAHLSAPVGLSKHIPYSALQMDSLTKLFHSNQSGTRQLSWGFPSKGKQKILVLAIEYPDLTHTYSASAFNSFMNDSGYNTTGSFRDYYKHISYNQFDLEADVYGWFVAPNGYKSYGRNAGFTAAADLVSQVIDSAEAAGIDFSKYDNDGDGQVDGLMVIHSGPGAEEGSQLDYIWSYRSSLWGSNGRFYDNVSITDYCLMPETRSYGMVGIGVYCHEFGHIMGLPDLYDTDGGSEGLGNFSLMAGGCWLNSERTPACMDAWCKTQLDWIHPTQIPTLGDFYLAPSVTDSTTWRINTSNPDEYFLLENRQNKDFDASLPGHGLAIFHIDKSVTDRYPGSNDVNADENHKGIDLEEADGQYDLDKSNNRGDQGDLYPGYYSKMSFSATTDPNSDLYTGVQSSITISGIKEINDTIFFTFGMKPQAGFTVPTTKGCTPFQADFTSSALYADSVSWSINDTGFYGQPLASFTFDSAGTYSLKQRVYDSTGTAVDSMTSSITVVNTPMADFTYSISGYKVSFVNQSTAATGYYWTFGNGFTSSQKNPTITYAGPGTYTVSLIAKNQSICRDTIAYTLDLFALGIEKEEVKTRLSLFPNPATASVSLVVPGDEQGWIDVYNALGESVKRVWVTGGTNQLTWSGPSGIYILRFTSTAGKSETLRVSWISR